MRDLASGPLVSIITPSFNQARWLADNLGSVAAQSYPRVEQIVVDGGSTDGSVDLLRTLAGTRVRWSSEPDEGQSAAINKGFRAARGDIIGWLNSDDAYFDGRTVDWVVRAFARYPEVDVIYGHAALVNAAGLILHAIWVPSFSWPLLRRFNFIIQPAVFLRRSALADDWLVNEEYHSAMDRELWLRLASQGRQFRRLPRILAIDRHQPGRKVYTRPDLGRVDVRRLESIYGIPNGRLDTAARKALKIALRLAGVTLVREVHGAALAFSGMRDGWSSLLARQVITPRALMPMDEG